MSASYYIEQEAKLLKIGKRFRDARTEYIRKEARSASLLIREAARRELLRRQIWGESK